VRLRVALEPRWRRPTPIMCIAAGCTHTEKESTRHQYSSCSLYCHRKEVTAFCMLHLELSYPFSKDLDFWHIQGHSLALNELILLKLWLRYTSKGWGGMGEWRKRGCRM